ncbi:Ribosomal protein S20 [Dirofilaria immitis]|nr:Ribosomal protein S20 [Dirofilaria immitis]
MDVPFESVDLTTAIGAEMEKQRSGVFVGFLRNLFTERKGKLYEVVAEWKQTKITPPVPPRRRPPTRKTKKLIKNRSFGKIPDISHPSLREDVLNIISSRKNATTVQFIRKRPVQSTTVVETKKKRKKYEEILVKQNGLTINSMSKSGSTEFVQCRVSCPVTVNSTRKWTIEEDRKILYIHKENESDLDLTLASIQLELPEIPVDELRQRLAFLLSLLQRVDKTDNK